jgi:ribosomal protein L11 methyltransferase
VDGASAASWRVRLAVPLAKQELFEAALQHLTGAIVLDPPAAGLVALQVHCVALPDRARLLAALSAAAAAAGVDVPTVRVEPLANADWVAKTQEGLPPIRVGRFYVFGSHDTGSPPLGTIPIRIDAGMAFGTGRHESTQGCLLALCGLRRRRQVRTAVDMGCGSGILAIAMAKLWGCRVIAVDNDPTAVRVTRDNARLNGVGPLIRVVLAQSYDNSAVARAGPYQLIAANILAEPLCAMAGGLKRALAPRGAAVLSGLLVKEQTRVMNRHRALGLRLVRRLQVGDWSTLVLTR